MGCAVLQRTASPGLFEEVTFEQRMTFEWGEGVSHGRIFERGCFWLQDPQCRSEVGGQGLSSQRPLTPSASLLF